MKDSKGEDPASKFVKRRQAEGEDDDRGDLRLSLGWFIGIGVGIVLAIGGVIIWLINR